MNRLLESDLDAQTLPEFELKVAMKSVACIVSYLDLLQDDESSGRYTLSQFNLAQFMKLDASAVKALNLLPGPKEGNKNTNLYGLLNKCRTAQGSRMLGQWIKQPLMSIPDISTLFLPKPNQMITIEKRQDIVSIFVENAYLREMIQENCLKAFPDLHRLSKKFQRGKANLQDVLRVYQVILSLPQLIEELNAYDGENAALLKDVFVSKLQHQAENLEKLKELVETTIDLEASNHHEYVIKADFDPKLCEIKTKMDDTLKQMQKEARKVADNLGLEYEKKLKFEHSPQYGYHLRLSRNDSSRIRNSSNYIELKTVKAGALFVTKTLRTLSSEHSDLQSEYSKLQSDTAKEVISITATYFSVLEQCNQVVAELDVFVSLAEAATNATIPYIRPTMNDLGICFLSHCF